MGEVLRYLVWHVAELDSLPRCVVPVAATVVLVGRARSLDAPLQAFLAGTLALTVWLVPVVAAFASRLLGPDRGAQPLLRRAALRHRPARLDRPRRAASTCARPGRRGGLGAARPADPVRPLPDDVGDHGHAHAAAVLVAAGSNRLRLDHARGLRRYCALSAVAFLLVPRALRRRPPAARPRLWAVSLKPIWWGKHGFERFSRGSLFQGIHGPRAGLDRPRAPRRRGGRVPLDRPHRPAHREPERILQPRSRAGVLRGRADCPAACRRRASRSTARPAR